MNKRVLIVDVTKCNNCQNCTMAVKDEYVGNTFPGYSVAQPEQGHEWITVDRHVRGHGAMVDVSYLPRTCNHCDNAPCIAAGQGAVIKRADGIVIIDPVKSKGRKDLVQSCPYGSIYWNEEAQVPQHWTFDAHLLDAGWQEPRCVQVCPSGALRSLNLPDEKVEALVSSEHLQVLKPEFGTRPRVYYKGLERFSTSFVSGTVVRQLQDGAEENVEHAEVELDIEGQFISISTKTNAFGEFKIDGLPLRQDASFTVQIHHPRYGSFKVIGAFSESIYLGAILLT